MTADSRNIQITVRLFAVLAAEVGSDSLTLTLAAESTVGDALKLLCKTHEKIATMRDRVATAVNLAYVASNQVLVEGDELALIPPVSGG